MRVEFARAPNLTLVSSIFISNVVFFLSGAYTFIEDGERGRTHCPRGFGSRTGPHHRLDGTSQRRILRSPKRNQDARIPFKCSILVVTQGRSFAHSLCTAPSTSSNMFDVEEMSCSRRRSCTQPASVSTVLSAEKLQLFAVV